MVDYRDGVGKGVGFLEVLRSEHDGGALADQVADDLPHAVPTARVEACGRLVEEEQSRTADDRAGEVEPPAHTAGVRLDRARRRIREVEHVEQVAGAAFRLVGGQLVEPSEHDQVLAPGQVLVDGGVLA